MTIPYIDSAAGLDALCARLKHASWLAIDTEFMREKTYYPQLCLIQIATPDEVACIDPLALADLAPLLDLLYNPGVLKVLHAGRQDLEIFHHLRGAPPAPVFDTMLAATLLGHGEQIGYGALVKETLGVELEKAYSRTDWSVRPLSLEQIAYAADDVRYLVQVYQKQRAALEASGRLGWLAEDFAELASARLYTNSPEDAWQRIKGIQFLKGAQLAVVQQIAAWRERQAQKSDRPRRWVLKDEVIFDIAKQSPAGLQALARIRGLEKSTLERHGQTLLNLLDEGKKVPKENWPQLEKPPRLTADEEPLVDAMMALVRLRAVELNISPATLASRRDLEKFIQLGERSVLLGGWRGPLVGQDLQRLLRGDLSLSVDNGRLLVR